MTIRKPDHSQVGLVWHSDGHCSSLNVGESQPWRLVTSLNRLNKCQRLSFDKRQKSFKKFKKDENDTSNDVKKGD